MTAEPEQTPGQKWGCLIVVAVLVLGFVLVPVIGGLFGSDPREWLEDHYEYVSGENADEEPIVFGSDDDAVQTVAAIVNGTDPDDQRKGSSDSGSSADSGSSSDSGSSAGDSSTYYLRYDSDWLVTVAPDGGGARIELLAFDEGYRQYGAFIGFWGGYYGRGGGGFFRGGGSGFGK